MLVPPSTSDCQHLIYLTDGKRNRLTDKNRTYLLPALKEAFTYEGGFATLDPRNTQSDEGINLDPTMVISTTPTCTVAFIPILSDRPPCPS